MKNPPVSIIIPVFNEEKDIENCLYSLNSQICNPIEIIIVDDGSTDKTISLLRHSDIQRSEVEESRLIILEQNHKGPGTARNLGAKHAKGEILVFVDADMTFDENFIKDLVSPILKGETIGTFSKNEMVSNSKNTWSICWNINRNVPPDRMLPSSYPNTAPVFRAILKKEFNKVGGFDATGEYTDDWSLSKKLGKKSTAASGAIYYHANSESLKEIWSQARWIGKNRFIAGTLLRRTKSIIMYSFPMSLTIGIYKSAVEGQLLFVLFKIWYDFAVWSSVVSSFFAAKKYK